MRLLLPFVVDDGGGDCKVEDDDVEVKVDKTVVLGLVWILVYNPEANFPQLIGVVIW